MWLRAVGSSPRVLRVLMNSTGRGHLLLPQYLPWAATGQKTLLLLLYALEQWEQIQAYNSEEERNTSAFSAKCQMQGWANLVIFKFNALLKFNLMLNSDAPHFVMVWPWWIMYFIDAGQRQHPPSLWSNCKHKRLMQSLTMYRTIRFYLYIIFYLQYF